MLGAIKYSLANLLNGNGRDARQTFWYYVLFIVILRFLASMLVSIPMMVGTMRSAVSAAQQGSDPVAAQAQMMASMVQYMPRMMWLGLIVGVVSALLLAASFIRRLHDSDLSGWWAALPLALYGYALSRVPAQMDRAMEIFSTASSGTAPDPFAMMKRQGATALLTYLPIIIMIILGVRKSTDGANRFGDTPVSF
jgi:uncharacterized membrane protein YhaH (DUF805 family)